MASTKKTSPMKLLYDKFFVGRQHNAPPQAVTSSGSFNMNPPQHHTSSCSSTFTGTNHRHFPSHESTKIALSTPSPGSGQLQISTVNGDHNNRITVLEAENEDLQRQLRAYQQFTNNSTGNGRGKNSMAKMKSQLFTPKELMDCSTISEYVREIFFRHHKILAFEVGWQNFNSNFSQDVIANTNIKPPSYSNEETYWKLVLLPNFVKTFNEHKNNFRTCMKKEFAGK